MAALHIDGGQRLSGRAVAPPDKSIAHRALLLAALGRGVAEVECAAMGADNRATAHVLGQLGVRIERHATGVTVHGVGGPAGFAQPLGDLDCANSGTTLRLMAGVLAASSLEVTLTGDASLRSRPMGRLAPLIEMGAQIALHGEGRTAPLTVRGGPLRGGVHRLRIASAQVKSALILAGLWAEGETVVIEPSRSRDHTERMLAALGAPVTEDPDGAIRVQPLGQAWSCARYVVPPDLSSAAFLLGAALLTDSEDVVVETAINPTRAGILDVLRAFGADVIVRPLPSIGGEPLAEVSVRGRRLAGAVIGGALTLRAIDEIPLVAAIAAFLPGRTVITDAQELRVKESDRLTATARLVRAFGGVVDETPDGLVIDGDRSRLRAATVDGAHDHRIAMTAAVLGLAAPGTSVVEGSESAAVSFPGFAGTLSGLGARVREPSPAGRGEA